MANILVTGGAGFIGSHVANQLHKKEHKVIVVDNLSGGREQNLHPDIELFKHNCKDGLITAIFKTYEFDYVFHLAAYAAEGLSHFVREFNYENNVLQSVHLINQSIRHKVKRFIFTSSMAVYGAQSPPFEENMIPEPEDPYGIAKHAIERDLKVGRDLFGLKYTIFRPHNVYGPGQNFKDRYRNVVGIFLNQAIHGDDITIFGDGTQTRSFSYIDKIAWAISSCIDSPQTEGKTFNIGGENPYTVNELASKIKTITKSRSKIVHLQERHEVKHAYCNHQHAAKYLNWNVRKDPPLSEGLSQMYEWMKKQDPKKFNTKLPKIEIQENLPEFWKDKNL